MKIICYIIIFCSLLSGPNAIAAGKQRGDRNNSSDDLVSRVVKIEPIPNRTIEMPIGEGIEADNGTRDGTRMRSSSNSPTMEYRYGANITDRLLSLLVAGGSIVVVVDPKNGDTQIVGSSSSAQSGAQSDARSRSVQRSSRSEKRGPADPVRIDDPLLPSMELSAELDELWFTTGERATKVFYGFKPGFETPFNNGLNEGRNEFAVEVPNIAFGNTGGLHVGKELGSELNFDLFWVGAALKRMRYRAGMGLILKTTNLVTKEVSFQRLAVRTKGFSFQLSGVYLGYEAGIAAARRAAMTRAFDNLVTKTAEELVKSAEDSPLRAIAHVYNHNQKREIYIGLGTQNRKMKKGELFYNLSALNSGRGQGRFITDAVFESVSRLSVLSGVMPKEGDELISYLPGQEPTHLLAAQFNLSAKSSSSSIASASSSSESQFSSRTININDFNIEPSPVFEKFIESVVIRFFKGIKAMVTFPLRLARFLKYDQSYDEAAGQNQPMPSALALQQWAQQNQGLSQMSIPQAWTMVGTGSPLFKIALLDTGVDYNHSALRGSMASAPIPWAAQSASFGVDLFSVDVRSYDDHARGTALASAIVGRARNTLGVAPGVHIIPVKVFSPFGETTSAALYQGVQYALNAGARIIVMGWALAVRSAALEQALQLAAESDVLVVMASGDEGIDLDAVPRYPASFLQEHQALSAKAIVVAGLTENGDYLVRAGPLELSSNIGGVVELGVQAHGVKVAAPRGRTNEVHYSGVAAARAAGVAALVGTGCFMAGRSAVSARVLKDALVAGAEAPRGNTVGRLNAVKAIQWSLDQNCM